MNLLAKTISYIDYIMPRVGPYWRFRWLAKSIQSRILGKKLCPYCGEYRDELVTCDICGVAQCVENCYPPGEQKHPGHCSACEYPEG